MRNMLLALLFLTVCYKKGTMFYIRKYSTNMLYSIICNLLYYCLFHHRLLWDFKSQGLGTKLTRALHIFIITPLLTLLFSASYPKTSWKQILYTGKWLICSVAVEDMLRRCHCLYFANGWHLGWSAYLYIKLYLYPLYITKKPKLIICLSIANIIFFLKKFNVAFRDFDIRGFLIEPKQ